MTALRGPSSCRESRSASEQPSDVCTFGPFLVDPREQLLLREGRRVAVKPKVFETLLLLIRKAGHVADRDELMRELWPDAAVTEANLTQAVWRLRKALDDNEGEPRYVETIPRRGYRFLAAVTWVSRDEAETDQAKARMPARGRWRGVRVSIPLGGLVLVLLLALGATFLPSSRGARGGVGGAPLASPAGAKPRRSVAVLGFKNLSGRPEAAWLSTAFAEMLGVELAAGSRLRLLPPEHVARLELSPSSLDTALPPAGDWPSRIRTGLGADLLVLGSYVALGRTRGDRIRLDVRVHEVASGDLVASATAAGTEGELFDLVEDVGTHLRQQLGVGGLSPADAAMLRASLPSTPGAARLYAEGLARLRTFDALAALRLLEKAAAAEPQSGLIHSALAAAWSALGYDSKAREEARRAFDLSARLSREEGLSVEGRYWEAEGRWDEATRTYRILFGFYSDSLDYGLRLAEAQRRGGHAAEALSTLGTLRRLLHPGAQDPRIDLEEAQAKLSVSDFAGARASAARAAEQAASLGARPVAARALFQQGWAFLRTGEPAKALVAAEGARRILAELGDDAGVARALNLSGNACLDKGDLARAKAFFEEALAVYGRIGHRAGTADALTNIGIVFRQRGHLASARKAYLAALAIAREVGDRVQTGAVLSNLAVIQAQEGQLADARKTWEELLVIDRALGDRRSVAISLHNLAEVLWHQGALAEAAGKYEEALGINRKIGDRIGQAADLHALARVRQLQGDLAAARRCYEESLRIARGADDKSGMASTLQGFGDLSLAEDDLASARTRYGEALALTDELGERGSTAAVRLALARLFIEEGRAREAEQQARTATTEFDQERRLDDAAAARAVLVWAVLEQGRTAAASRALAPVLEASRRSQDVEVRLLSALTAARVQASSGRLEEARRGLETALAEARRLGLAAPELEVRLLLAGVEGRSGRAAGGRAGLEALAQEARSKGFRLIARRAADTPRKDPVSAERQP